jgi:hypothetical protein
MAVEEPSAVNPATQWLEDSYMQNTIVTIIFLLTLIGANGIVAQTANAADNPCIACQNRCLKSADYANCKLKCKGSSVCLGHKKRSR